jgi:hypothetical protein
VVKCYISEVSVKITLMVGRLLKKMHLETANREHYKSMVYKYSRITSLNNTITYKEQKCSKIKAFRTPNCVRYSFFFARNTIRNSKELKLAITYC